MTQAPAGWFDDGAGRLRYWDGSVWTDHYADTYAPPAGTAPPAGAAPPAGTFPPAQHPGFGPAPTTAQSFEPGGYSQAASTQAPDAYETQGYAAPSSAAGGELGYAVPGGAHRPASADPFAVPPRETAYQAPASAPRKKLPGWGITLIVLGGVLVALVIFGILAAIAIPVYLDQKEKEEAAGAGVYGSSAVPVELENAYLLLDQAYRDQSCEDLQAITTDNYLEYHQINPVTCEGAFFAGGSGSNWYSDLLHGEIYGDSARLATTEYFTEDGLEYYNDATYMLRKIDGEWMFDSAYYLSE